MTPRQHRRCCDIGPVLLSSPTSASPPHRLPPLPVMRTTAQTQAPGSRPEPRRMQAVSRMKYDLNAPTEMENITSEESSMFPCPKDTGGHYAPALTHLGKFPCLPSWTSLLR